MNDARKTILHKLPRAAQPEQARQHVDNPPRGPLPHSHPAILEGFIEKLTAAAGGFTVVGTLDELPAAVDSYLVKHDLTGSLTLAPHRLLKTLAWPAGRSLQFGHADKDTQTSLSVAEYGIAETGSLVLSASPHTPTTLNFLADHFLCVLPISNILAHLENIWDRIRTMTGPQPRVINLITGPSRTADVEQIIQLGAHGPRHLHVFMLKVM